jgi:hypothetical protein
MTDPVNIRELNTLLRISQSLVATDIISADRLHEIGEDIVDRIRTRTRLGFGVGSDGARKEKFRPLKLATVEQREELDDEGKLSDLTKPDMANMTRFGSMMDSLTHRVLGEQVVVFFSEAEETKKAYYNTKLGRPFMYLSNLETKAVTKMVKESVDEWLDSIIRNF